MLARMSELLDLVRELVSIDSVNPALTPEGAGEARIAERVRGWCRDRGLETHWLEKTPGRPSVVAVAPGQGGGRALMLNAHLDTVGTAGMTAPFEPRLEGGRIYGRGAMDMKASLAACMRVAAQAAAAPHRGDVLLAAVSDEEHASLGTREVLQRFGADGAVVTEPTDLDLHVAHRGFFILDIDLHGLASHTSQPERGVNAVTRLGRVLREIEALDARLRDRPPHPLLGFGSAQAVLASGGRELFTTPDHARVSFERRTLPGERGEDVRAEVDEMLERAGEGDEHFRASVTPQVHREPFEVEGDAPLVGAVEDALHAQRGRPPRRAGAPYWTDAALFAAAGVPTVLAGPIGGGIHGRDEWVDVDSVDLLARALNDAARTFCG